MRGGKEVGSRNLKTGVMENLKGGGSKGAEESIDGGEQSSGVVFLGPIMVQ